MKNYGMTKSNYTMWFLYAQSEYLLKWRLWDVMWRFQNEWTENEKNYNKKQQTTKIVCKCFSRFPSLLKLFEWYIWLRLLFLFLLVVVVMVVEFENCQVINLFVKIFILTRFNLHIDYMPEPNSWWNYKIFRRFLSFFVVLCFKWIDWMDFHLQHTINRFWLAIWSIAVLPFVWCFLLWLVNVTVVGI